MPVATSSSESSKWLGLTLMRAFVCMCARARACVSSSARETDIERKKREEILKSLRLFQFSGYASHLLSSNVT